MPVRFICENCRRLLSVSRRKIGTQIDCPRCGFSQPVPTLEVAAVSVAMAQGAREARKQTTADPDLVVYDNPEADDADEDDLPVIDTSRHSLAPAVDTSPPAVSETADQDWERVYSEPTSQQTQALPADPGFGEEYSSYSTAATYPSARAEPKFIQQHGPMLLIRRQVLYWQAGLLVFCMLLALGIGVLIGRGVGPIPQNQLATADKVLVRGTVTYTDRQAGLSVDNGAVVLVVPEGHYPRPKLTGDNFHPRANPPAAGGRDMLALEEIGGRYDRTNAEGSFTLDMPRPGRYILVIISHDTLRASDEEIGEQDVSELRHYLLPPQAAIGNQRYVLKHIELAGEVVTTSHDFGRK